MIPGYLILSILFLAVSCIKDRTPLDRAEQLARESLKIIRLEEQAHARGIALEGEVKLADSLFAELVEKMDQSNLRTFLETDSGPDRERIVSFLDTSGRLKAPENVNDPAGAIISVLQKAPERGEKTEYLMDGYGAAFLLNMEGRRDLRLRLEIISFIQALGCPVTFRDLGLASVDSLRLKVMAEKAAEKSSKQPYDSGPFDFYLAMTRLNWLGSRFGRQMDGNDLAAMVMSTGEFQQILPALENMKPVRIGFFGDSNTDNRHWSSPAHFPNIVQAVFAKVNPSVTVFNAGRGGDDSGEGLARMDSTVIEQKPDICFILFGGNDCAHWGRPNPSVPPGQFHRNMIEIVIRLRKVSCRPVLMPYPIVPELTEADLEVLKALNLELAAVRDSLNTEWLDLATEVNKGDVRRFFAVDRIHLSPEAHLFIAGKILEFLSRIR